MTTRSKSGISKPISHLNLNVTTESPLPRSHLYAISDPNWLQAMTAEYDALISNGTWALVPRPTDVNVVRSMWLFKKKYKADGSLERYKARLVANGRSQCLGIDYFDTFSPVVKPETIRTVLSLALSKSWHIHQLDVKNAFLNETLSETVYMHQPPGFRDKQHPDYVCLLRKSLYGLKQAPRAWFQRFATFMMQLGFLHSRCDSSLFIYHHGASTAYLLLYMDDIILTASSQQLLDNIISRLRREFAMSNLSHLSYFLGISTTKTSNGLFLSQQKYAKDILTRANMLECNPARTPADRAALPCSQTSVTIYSWNSISGLQLHATPTDALLAYSDADWGGCPSTRRSTSGYYVFLVNNLISWSSKRQYTISRSSAEAEYRGVANAVAEKCWLRNLLRELHLPLLMSARGDRGWMYKRRNSEGRLCSYYQSKVNEFLNFAFSIEKVVERKTFGSDVVFRIKCPCSKCKIKVFKKRNEVKLDLWHNGFIRGYTTWYAHGERKFRRAETGECSEPIEEDNGVGCTQMILDIHNATFQSHRDTQEEQAPNSFAKQYYEMLEADDEPLYEGCQKFSTLEAATRLLNWKAECNVPEATYNRALSLFKDMLPGGNKLVRNFYDTKKILSKLDLPREKIHACKNHCMLFYGKVDYVLTKCFKGCTCQKKMSKEMIWHHDQKTDSNKMVHPSDGKAWKHFDSTDPTFFKEIRNVRIGLCTDGFNPNNSNSNPYSLWYVFLTIYNLPPWMSLKDIHFKLSLVIPGRKNSSQNLDVFLQPLIKELKTLWNDGVETYDAYRKNNFNMKATLLWTVSDFPTYAMLSIWSTHGKLACPYCMGNVDSFQLRNGGKPCWFDCHRIFLPARHPYRRDRKGFF
ncbi:ribonuclease H-like domain-containing protein [Tanacetum coccineum]